MKQKHIIALFGKANCGKTSTLRMLYNRLSGHQGNIGEDIRAVCKYKGCNVLFATWGDNLDEMDRNVGFMKSQTWDIAVTATRTRGGTVHILENYTDEIGANLSWIAKKYAEPEGKEEETVANQEDEAKILKTIDDIIDGKNPPKCQ